MLERERERNMEEAVIYENELRGAMKSLRSYICCNAVSTPKILHLNNKSD
jgi:hypothetical protein